MQPGLGLYNLLEYKEAFGGPVSSGIHLPTQGAQKQPAVLQAISDELSVIPVLCWLSPWQGLWST